MFGTNLLDATLKFLSYREFSRLTTTMILNEFQKRNL